MPTATLQRAYSLVQFKAADDEKRIIEGIATTVTPDRADDIVEAEGIEFQLPLPLLYQHNSRQPIGKVFEAKRTKKSIAIKARFAPAGTADFIDEAWALTKAGLLGGLSIGFRSLEEAFNRETGGFHFLRSEWIELSIVTIPMNAEATITTIRSADALYRPTTAGTSAQSTTIQVTDAPQLAAFGSKARGVHLKANLPGVSGLTKGKKIMTVSEHISSLEAKRAANAARMGDIVQHSVDENRTRTESEIEEYDTLNRDVTAIDAELVTLRAHEKTIVTKAAAVPSHGSPEEQQRARGNGNGTASVSVTVKPNLPKGTAFTRYAIAKINCRGRYEAAEFAKQWADSTPEVEAVLRAEMSPGTTTHVTWAKPLVPLYQSVAGEFLELLRPATIIGRIPGLRRVPFNTRVPAQTGGGIYQWVGEAKAKPVGQLAFSEVTLKWAKVAGIIVISKELARLSNPSAEAIIRDDMVAGAQQYLDQQFIDPAVAAVPDVSPASITNGVTPIPASGTTADAFRADMADLFAAFITANLDPSTAVLLMSAQLALQLSLLTNPLGQPEFPTISMAGGAIIGLPVVISQTVGNRIILLNARDILLADEGGVEIDVSEEASLQMNSTPNEPAGSPITNTELVSLWQRNLVGLRMDRFITWQKARSQAVQYISGANYGG